MSGFKPSPQQQKAIDTDGKALLVSAAAGSGKTTVLVQRVMRLLCNAELSNTADRLMVVTFTVAAATKLKNDLNHELSERISRQEGDVARLKKQRMLLSRAAIGTFDSFCKNLCCEFFAKLDIEPDFKVGERLTLDIIEAQAMEDTLNEMLCDPDFDEFAQGFSDPRNLNEVSGAIKMLHRRMINQPHPEQYLEKQLEEVIPRELGSTSAGAMLFNYAEDALQNAVGVLKKAVSYSRENGVSSSAIDILCNELEFTEELTRLVGAGGYSAFRTLYLQRGGKAGYARLNQGKGVDLQAREVIKQLRNEAKATVTTLYETYFLQDPENLAEISKRHYRLVGALCRATLCYYKRLKEEKREAACFDFYDLQHMTVDLLERTELGIQGRFFAVMVDEYQDTNPIADYIYHTLVGENYGALFMVGDVKQSIYSFNSARPDIFADRVKNCEHSKNSQVVYLAANYRSSPEVIHSVNDLFGLLMSKPIGGVDYDENNRLYPGRVDETKGATVQMRLVDKEAELPSVAQLCRKLIDDGHSPEDICILVQTNKAVAIYSKELERFGMIGGASGDIKPIDEVGAMPLIALLRFLANPFSEVDLMAVLLSPLGGFVVDDLVGLKKDTSTRMILAMQVGADPKLKAFSELLWELKKISTGVSARQLLQIIYERLDAYVICCAMSVGAMKAIKTIENLAQQYDSVGQNGLSGFVKQMNLALERTDTSKKASETQKGMVNVMTIHTSKGLEFPICILADTGDEFNTRDLSLPVLQHEKTSIGIRLAQGDDFIDTPFRQAAAIANRLDLQSERMRLLYVATTRAKEQLHLFVSAKKKKIFSLACSLYGVNGVTPFLLSKCNCFADYLLYFGLSHPQGRILRELADDVPVVTMQNTGELFVSVLEEIPTPEINAQEDMPEQDNAELLRLFEFRYRYETDTKQPIKTSVTQLVEKDMVAPRLSQPSFVRQNSDGAKRGSATHEFLQLCDLRLASIGVEEEMKRLVGGAYLDEEQANLVNIASVQKFFETELSRRILNSNEVYREYEFMIEHDGTIIQGIADLLFIENDEITLVDYKTTRANEQELFQLYHTQLSLYCDAIGRRFGKRVKQSIIYSFYLDREIDISKGL